MSAVPVQIRDRLPGSLTGRCPVGNAGRARVPATQPMPIRATLAELLRGADR